MTSENAEKSTTRWVLVFAIVGFLAVVVALGLIEYKVYISFHKWEHRGLFGDMFGVGNAIFSALAFLGVIVAIFLQKKELELQRKELQWTREEVKGQREQLESQAVTLKKQTLENTFFELLRFHQEILQAVRYNHNAETRGREAIRHLAGKFRKKYNNSEQKESEGERIRDAYNEFHHNFQPHIGHYFRNLYQILRFINDSPSEADDKKLYGRLVSSHPEGK